MPSSGPPTRNQVNELMASIDDLSGEIDLLRSELTRLKFRTRLITALLILASALMVVGGVLVSENKRTVNELNRSRAERTTTACIYANNGIQADRAALVNSLRALVPAGQELTAEQQERLTAYADAVELAKPYRDCSPAGITAYYANPPVDPATGG